MKHATFKLSEEVLAVQTAGEDVLMDYRSGKYFGIRGAMRCLVEPLREGLSMEQMLERVSEHFSVPEAVAEEDLRNILPKLLDGGLIQRMEQP